MWVWESGQKFDPATGVRYLYSRSHLEWHFWMMFQSSKLKARKFTMGRGREWDISRWQSLPNLGRDTDQNFTKLVCYHPLTATTYLRFLFEWPRPAAGHSALGGPTGLANKSGPGGPQSSPQIGAIYEPSNGGGSGESVTGGFTTSLLWGEKNSYFVPSSDGPWRVSESATNLARRKVGSPALSSSVLYHHLSPLLAPLHFADHSEEHSEDQPKILSKESGVLQRASETIFVVCQAACLQLPSLAACKTSHAHPWKPSGDWVLVFGTNERVEQQERKTVMLANQMLICSSGMCLLKCVGMYNGKEHILFAGGDVKLPAAGYYEQWWGGIRMGRDMQQWRKLAWLPTFKQTAPALHM